MRRNLATTPDPLDVAALPPDDVTGLDLRIPPHPDDPRARREARVTLVVFPLLGLALLVLLRLLRVLPQPPWVLPLLALLALVLAVYAWSRRDMATTTALAWFLAPVAWLLSPLLPDRPPALLYGVPFGFAMLLAFLVARQIVLHGRAWYGANLGLSPAVREACRSCWSGADHRPAGGVLPPDVQMLEIREQRFWWLGQLAVPVAWAVGYVILRQLWFPGYFWAFAVVVALLLAWGFCLHITYPHRTPVTPPAHRIVHQAFVSWLTYNMLAVPAHGVLKSPPIGWLPWRHTSATCRYRVAVTGVTLITLSLAVIPAAAYFPVTAWWTGPHDASSALQPYSVYEHQSVAWIHCTASGAVLNPYDPRSAPELWLAVALRGVIAGSPICLWSLFWSLLLCLTASVLLLWATLYAVGGRILLHHYATLEAADAYYRTADPTTPWQAITNRLTYRHSERT